MPWLYLLGSLAGIGLIVGLNFVLSRRRGESIFSLAAAEARLVKDIPGFAPGDSVLSEDGIAALIVDRAHRVTWLVGRQGDGMLARTLEQGTLQGLTRDGLALTLKLDDFTARRMTLTFADTPAADLWEQRLRAALT